MPNPAHVDDVVTRWRPLSAQETTNAGVLLDDAWRMLKRLLAAEGYDVEALGSADADYLAETIRVLATAVIRVLKNPDGMKSETIDDYTYTRSDADADGCLDFTSDEIAALMPGASTGRVAFTIDPLSDYASRWM